MSTICVPYTQPSVSENVVTPEGGHAVGAENVIAPNGGQITVVAVPPIQNTVTYSERFTAGELRLARLKRYRLMFSIFCLVLAVAAITLAAFGLPYQPPIAVGISALGIVIVFIIKIRDAGR